MYRLLFQQLLRPSRMITHPNNGLFSGIIREFSIRKLKQQISKKSQGPPRYPNYAPIEPMATRIPALKIATADSNYQMTPGFKQSLVAFGARIGANFSDPTLLLKALNFQKEKNLNFSANSELIKNGDKILREETEKFLKSKYPNLADKYFERVLDLYVGQHSLSQLGVFLGLHFVIHGAGTETNDELLSKGILALIGAFQKDKGTDGCLEWVNNYILTRDIDATSVVQTAHPKRELSQLLKSKNLPTPTSRIINQTGRYSNASMYVVGVFSGTQMLHQGHGKSIKEAENLAARNAIVSLKFGNKYI